MPVKVQGAFPVDVRLGATDRAKARCCGSVLRTELKLGAAARCCGSVLRPS